MDLPVKFHIDRIQKRIESLSAQLMNSKDRALANEVEAQIRSLKLALAHYELALKIENEIVPNKKESSG